MDPITRSSVARSVPFDNTTNGFLSTDVQSAIEESVETIGAGYNKVSIGKVYLIPVNVDHFVYKSCKIEGQYVVRGRLIVR
jgi:hypothetical protein